jgi:Protein of unknown function (DUF3048).
MKFNYNKPALILSFLLLFTSITITLGRKTNNIDDIAKPVNNNTAIKNDTKETSSNKYISPYTGEELTKTAYSNTPFMAIIENSKDARPQSGLADADMVFETMAEGGIPRFIALFYKNSPSVIGPIRSARSYFINIAKEYNLPFAHCGGSDEALQSIKSENLMSLNEMTNGKYFWRDNTRKSPHNLYTSADKIRDLIQNKEYNKQPNSSLTFNDTYWNSNKLNISTELTMTLNKYYSVAYKYQDTKYVKYIDNDLAMDKATNKPLTVQNIVIQITTMQLQKDGQHLNIDLVGTGTGYVLSKGKVEKIIWIKKSLQSATSLLTENGAPIPLSVGNTWWHIVDNNASIKFH